MSRIGVISDTHRLIRPEAVSALRGVDLIIHAGDMGSSDIVQELRRIAPVRAVRGNVDVSDRAREFPETAVVELEGLMIYVIHNLIKLDIDPRAAGCSAVIYGHSHIPAQEMRDGVLYFNPGSAGPRRFHLPVSIGFLDIRDGKIFGELLELTV
jgi:uncharacterized protein